MNRRLSILLVDDEVIVRQSMAMLLKRAGHEVIGVGNGESALAMMARRPFDLVISDLSMAGMQGDELVERIRQLLPGQPIIMVTAFAEEYRIFGRGTGGVDALLLKPFTFLELTDTITQVMAEKTTPFPLGVPPSLAGEPSAADRV